MNPKNKFSMLAPIFPLMLMSILPIYISILVDWILSLLLFPSNYELNPRLASISWTCTDKTPAALKIHEVIFASPATSISIFLKLANNIFPLLLINILFFYRSTLPTFKLLSTIVYKLASSFISGITVY